MNENEREEEITPMSHRIFNFSAGPAMLPTEVLEKSAQALLDYEGKGFGIAEVSHRGKEFDAVADETILRSKQLLGCDESAGYRYQDP